MYHVLDLFYFYLQKTATTPKVALPVHQLERQLVRRITSLSVYSSAHPLVRLTHRTQTKIFVSSWDLSLQFYELYFLRLGTGPLII